MTSWSGFMKGLTSDSLRECSAAGHGHVDSEAHQCKLLNWHALHKCDLVSAANYIGTTTESHNSDTAVAAGPSTSARNLRPRSRAVVTIQLQSLQKKASMGSTAKINRRSNFVQDVVCRLLPLPRCHNTPAIMLSVLYQCGPTAMCSCITAWLATNNTT